LNNGTTFKQQAEWFMNNAVNRKRKPIKPATVSGWQNILEKWLIPALGDAPLAAITNLTLKELVAKMSAAKLSAKTIDSYSGLFKQVLASAVDDKTGNRLFPITWNHEFVDMPIIGKQHQPSLTEEEMARVVAAPSDMQMLYVLLAASGLRAGEALGLEIKYLSSDGTISIEQSAWEGDIQTPKTANSVRILDIPTSVAALLRQYIGTRSEGFVFPNRKGKVLLQTNILSRDFHPLLKELGLEKSGFHTFRRFHTTWFRKQGAPEDFIRVALGHANKSVTDEYSKLYRDKKFRKEMVENFGTGFEVPSVVRTVRKSRKK
jgi:integrase